MVDPFVDAYVGGTTPSPCVRCNRGVKLPELLRLARELGAERVATGHYARIVRQGERYELHRARDHKKDQSYFLHMLDQATLARLSFPLGELDKDSVRAEAKALDLPGADKGESQELCFVPNGRYDAFVAERAPDRLRPGPILDDQGRPVGQHAGIHGYTLGQRKSLGVALGRRAYVVGIDPEKSSVRLGDRSELLVGRAARRDQPRARRGAAVRVQRRDALPRQRAPRAGAGAREGLTVELVEPMLAVVPGQFAVFMRGERVLGGGVIRETVAAERVSVSDAALAAPLETTA